MEEPTKKTQWVLPILVTVIGGFMFILDSSIVNVALSTIMHAFNVDTKSIEESSFITGQTIVVDGGLTGHTYLCGCNENNRIYKNRKSKQL